MANYKSKSKHHTSDRFISYVLIGFAATFFIIIISIILYNMFSKELDYTSVTHIEDQTSVYNMPEDEYLVYFYTANCGACKALKYDVLGFADNNKNDVKVYFVDLDVVRSTQILTVPAEIQYTPSIMVIVNGINRDIIIGAGDDGIPAVFDAINEGTYQYFD